MHYINWLIYGFFFIYFLSYSYIILLNDEIVDIKEAFQDGCKIIVDHLTSKSVTVNDPQGPNEICDAIDKYGSNRYNNGYSSGYDKGKKESSIDKNTIAADPNAFAEVSDGNLFVSTCFWKGKNSRTINNFTKGKTLLIAGLGPNLWTWIDFPGNPYDLRIRPKDSKGNEIIGLVFWWWFNNQYENLNIKVGSPETGGQNYTMYYQQF